MQIRNDRRLSPWDLERDSSVLIPIALENSPDVLSGEVWQGVTEPAAAERGDREKRPQVLAIKINLPRMSMKRNPLVKSPPRTAQGSWKRSTDENRGCASPCAKVKATHTPEEEEMGGAREGEGCLLCFPLVPVLSPQPCHMCTMVLKSLPWRGCFLPVTFLMAMETLFVALVGFRRRNNGFTMLLKNVMEVLWFVVLFCQYVLTH